MRRTYHQTGYTIGMTEGDNSVQPSNNHFKSASLTKKLAHDIEAMGLSRVAGNVYISKSTVDFWKVQDGKIQRLTKTEVDNGEELAAAPKNDPSSFLSQVLDDLTF